MKAALCIALLLVTVGCASANNGKPKQIVVYSRATSGFKQSDAGYTFTDDLVASASNSKVIGYGDGSCQYLPASKDQVICTIVHALPDGNGFGITVRTNAKGSVIVVNGGFGKYAGVKASATLTVVKAGLRKYTYTLL